MKDRELWALHAEHRQSVAHLAWVIPPELPGASCTWPPAEEAPRQYLCRRDASDIVHTLTFKWAPRNEYPICAGCRRQVPTELVEELQP